MGIFDGAKESVRLTNALALRAQDCRNKHKTRPVAGASSCVLVHWQRWRNAGRRHTHRGEGRPPGGGVGPEGGVGTAAVGSGGVGARLYGLDSVASGGPRGEAALAALAAAATASAFDRCDPWRWTLPPAGDALAGERADLGERIFRRAVNEADVTMPRDGVAVAGDADGEDDERCGGGADGERLSTRDAAWAPADAAFGSAPKDRLTRNMREPPLRPWPSVPAPPRCSALCWWALCCWFAAAFVPCCSGPRLAALSD